MLAVAVHLRRESKIGLETKLQDRTLELIPSGVLYFGSAPRLSQALLEQLAEHDNDSIERVVVNLSELGRLDYTGALELKAFLDDCEAAGLEASFRDPPEHAMGTLRRSLGM